MNWLIYLLALGILAYSVYRGWKLVDIYRRRSAGQMWTPIMGKVTDKRIKSAGRGMYYPEISYSYTVMGIEYKNKYKMGTSFLGQTKTTVEHIGDAIGLRYNPQNPKQGIADEEKVGAMDIYLVAMGFIVFIIVLFSAIGPIILGK